MQDFARGIPVDYNTIEQRYNWELLYCELYAGGKYNNAEDESYQYSLGTNGLGLCSTQYASEYMDVEVKRDGFKYTLHFEKGENVGGLHKEPYAGKDTGTKTRWKPDLDVFTDIDVPLSYYMDILRRQAVVNDGLLFVLRDQQGGRFETTEFMYKNGIVDDVTETVGEDALTPVQVWETERRGRDRADKPEYTVKMTLSAAASGFSSRRKAGMEVPSVVVPMGRATLR